MRLGKHEISISVCTALLLGSTMLVSCEGAATVVPDITDRDNVRVGFRIEIGEGVVPTKATPPGNYDDGTGTDFENYIDIVNEGYRILFFDTDNRYLTSFQPRSILPVGSEQTRSKAYDVIGKVDRLLPENFKVVVLANWPSYPTLAEGVTTIDDICTGSSGRYAYTAPYTLSEERLIPMYGVKSYGNIKFVPENITYLETIHLLRAMAKVEVNCPTEGWTLEKVTLTRYNRTGYCAPENVYEESDYVKGSYEADYVDELHLVPGAAEEKEIEFRSVSTVSHAIYVPEYRNASQGARLADACEIRVKFKERDDKVYTIEFKYYDNAPSGSKIGDYFDIRRNYYYRFNISKRTEYGEPVISIDVLPYEQWVLEPEFGL